MTSKCTMMLCRFVPSALRGGDPAATAREENVV